MSGAYAGNINWQTPGSPPEHCLARWLDDETNGTAHGFRVQVSLDQIGTALSGIFQGRDITTTCELEGTVAEDGTMRWNSTRCAQPCYHFAHPTLMCPALDICLVERTVVADFEAGRIVGTHRVVWNAVEAESGSPHGQVTFEGDLDIQR